jgi:hypothetical protein
MSARVTRTLALGGVPADRMNGLADIVWAFVVNDPTRRSSDLSRSGIEADGEKKLRRLL